MNIPGLKSRIGRRLIVYILLFSLMIILIGTGLQLYLDFDHDIQSIHAIFEQIESSYLQSIINSLWVSDDELLRIQLEGISLLPDMQLVDIRKGAELIQRVGTPQTESIIEQTIPLIYVYDGHDVYLGDLHVVASLKGVYARFLDQVFVILSIQAANTILVSLFIFFLFYHLAVRHIIDMASHVESMRFESMAQPLQLNRKHGRKSPDEIDQLATSFNRMRENLTRYITERDRSTVALAESEERFRTICENAPALINAFDENGRCTYWNQQCRKTFGWTIDEINTHSNALKLFYPDPAVYDEVSRSFARDQDGDFREWHPVTKTGETLATMWANFRLPGGSVFSLGHDITERKQGEATMIEQMDELRRWRDAVVGREDRVIEIKLEVNELLTRLGEPLRYANAERNPIEE